MNPSTANTDPQDPTTVRPIQARQGDRRKTTLLILAGSLIAAIAVLGLALTAMTSASDAAPPPGAAVTPIGE